MVGQPLHFGCNKCKIDEYEPIRRITCPKRGVRIVMVIEPLWDAIAGISDKDARKMSEKLGHKQSELKGLLNGE
jgi:hypothetical protein